MTPSLTVILAVFFFWTIPASLAVIAYRRTDRSAAEVKASVRRSLQPALNLVQTGEANARLET